MEYKIISGRTVEIRRSYLSVRSPGEPPKRRGARKAGSSSEKKIRANEVSQVRELARLININFPAGSGFLSLKYDPAHLPADFAAAKKFADAFMRKFRDTYRKEHGFLPVTILINANWSPKHKCPARLHHHLLVPEDGIELARRLWQGGGFNLECLDGRGDHTDLAAYLIANLNGMPNEKHWHASRNIGRPIYTEPVPVQSVEAIKPERGSVLKDFQPTKDEDGNLTSCYLRCVLPEPPRVRGGQIIMTRRKGGGGHA